MTNTEKWLIYFSENANKRKINWEQPATITDLQKSKIIKSLQAWQLGETSDGTNLINTTKKYALEKNDSKYLDTIILFIKEEQKHGENLGKYLDKIGVKRLKNNLGDNLFRKVRHFNSSIEVWTITVIIVECFAQIYYKTISNSVDCKLLKEICKDILIDEAPHIKFQLERLSDIVQNQSSLAKIIRTILYFILFLGITSAVWIGHYKAFNAGKMDFLRYFKQAKHKFNKIKVQLFGKEFVNNQFNKKPNFDFSKI